MTTLVLLLLVLLGPRLADAREGLWGQPSDATRICRAGEFYFFSDPVGIIRMCTNGQVLDLGSAPTPYCGDGLVNRPGEQCDASGGIGQAGVCGAATNCSSSCTCLTPACPGGSATECPGGSTAMNCVSLVCQAKCGNFVVDAGEPCDRSAADDPLATPQPLCSSAPTSCAANCTCITACGNEVIEAGEECETATSAVLTYGNALVFDRNACTGATCAKVWDSVSNRNTYSFTGANTPFTFMAKFQPTTANNGGAQYIWFNGGSDTIAGWSVHLNNAGGITFPTSDTDAVGGTVGTLATSGASGTFADLDKITVFVTKAATGAIYTAVGTATAVTQNTTTGSIVANIIDNNSGQRPSIGGTNVPSSSFDGMIDEIAVWNRVLSVAEMNARIATPVTEASESGLVGLWHADETGGTTLTDSSPTGATFNLVQGSTGTVSFATSPFLAEGGGGTGTTACPGETCNPSTCQCEGTGGSNGMTYYISVTGDDNANNGLSTGAPWRTFARAFDAGRNDSMKPGDILVLRNGVFGTGGTSGSGNLDLRCKGKSSGGPATVRNASAATPITIRAENAQQASIFTDGLTAAVELYGCSGYKFEDFWVRNQDNTASNFDFRAGGTFTITHGFDGTAQLPSTDITLTRMQVYRNNRQQNQHLVAIENSRDILLDHVNVYDGHRHQFSIWKSRNVTIRDSYANSRSRDDLPGGFASWSGGSGGGDETISIYQSSDCVIENFVSENDNGSIMIHGGSTYDGQRGGSNNRISGVASFSDIACIQVNPRTFGLQYPVNNVIQDVACINTGAHTNAFNVKSSVGTVLRSITAFGTDNDAGISASDDSAVPCSGAPVPGCGLTVLNFASLNTVTAGLDMTIAAVFRPSSALCRVEGGITNDAVTTGSCTNVSNTFSTTTPTGMGLTSTNCVFPVTGLSGINGAGIATSNGPPWNHKGANPVCRYVNAAMQPGSRMWVAGTAPAGNCVSGSTQPCSNAFTGCVYPVIAGITDVDGDSCFDAHERFNLGVGGCAASTVCP